MTFFSLLPRIGLKSRRRRVFARPSVSRKKKRRRKRKKIVPWRLLAVPLSLRARFHASPPLLLLLSRLVPRLSLSLNVFCWRDREREEREPFLRSFVRLLTDLREEEGRIYIRSTYMYVALSVDMLAGWMAGFTGAPLAI